MTTKKFSLSQVLKGKYPTIELLSKFIQKLNYGFDQILKKHLNHATKTRPGESAKDFKYSRDMRRNLETKLHPGDGNRALIAELLYAESEIAKKREEKESAERERRELEEPVEMTDPPKPSGRFVADFPGRSTPSPFLPPKPSLPTKQVRKSGRFLRLFDKAESAFDLAQTAASLKDGWKREQFRQILFDNKKNYLFLSRDEQAEFDKILTYEDFFKFITNDFTVHNSSIENTFERILRQWERVEEEAETFNFQQPSSSLLSTQLSNHEDGYDGGATLFADLLPAKNDEEVRLSELFSRFSANSPAHYRNSNATPTYDLTRSEVNSPEIFGSVTTTPTPQDTNFSPPGTTIDGRPYIPEPSFSETATSVVSSAISTVGNMVGSAAMATVRNLPAAASTTGSVLLGTAKLLSQAVATGSTMAYQAAFPENQPVPQVNPPSTNPASESIFTEPTRLETATNSILTELNHSGPDILSMLQQPATQTPTTVDPKSTRRPSRTRVRRELSTESTTGERSNSKRSSSTTVDQLLDDEDSATSPKAANTLTTPLTPIPHTPIPSVTSVPSAPSTNSINSVSNLAVFNLIIEDLVQEINRTDFALNFSIKQNDHKLYLSELDSKWQIAANKQEGDSRNPDMEQLAADMNIYSPNASELFQLVQTGIRQNNWTYTHNLETIRNFQNSLQLLSTEVVSLRDPHILSLTSRDALNAISKEIISLRTHITGTAMKKIPHRAEPGERNRIIQSFNSLQARLAANNQNGSKTGANADSTAGNSSELQATRTAALDIVKTTLSTFPYQREKIFDNLANQADNNLRGFYVYTTRHRRIPATHYVTSKAIIHIDPRTTSNLQKILEVEDFFPIVKNTAIQTISNTINARWAEKCLALNSKLSLIHGYIANLDPFMRVNVTKFKSSGNYLTITIEMEGGFDVTNVDGILSQLNNVEMPQEYERKRPEKPAPQSENTKIPAQNSPATQNTKPVPPQGPPQEEESVTPTPENVQNKESTDPLVIDESNLDPKEIINQLAVETILSQDQNFISTLDTQLARPLATYSTKRDLSTSPVHNLTSNNNIINSSAFRPIKHVRHQTADNHNPSLTTNPVVHNTIGSSNINTMLPGEFAGSNTTITAFNTASQIQQSTPSDQINDSSKIDREHVSELVSKPSEQVIIATKEAQMINTIPDFKKVPATDSTQTNNVVMGDTSTIITNNPNFLTVDGTDGLIPTQDPSKLNELNPVIEQPVNDGDPNKTVNERMQQTVSNSPTDSLDSEIDERFITNSDSKTLSKFFNEFQGNSANVSYNFDTPFFDHNISLPLHQLLAEKEGLNQSNRLMHHLFLNENSRNHLLPFSGIDPNNPSNLFDNTSVLRARQMIKDLAEERITQSYNFITNHIDLTAKNFRPSLLPLVTFNEPFSTNLMPAMNTLAYIYASSMYEKNLLLRNLTLAESKRLGVVLNRLEPELDEYLAVPAVQTISKSDPNGITHVRISKLAAARLKDYFNSILYPRTSGPRRTSDQVIDSLTDNQKFQIKYMAKMMLNGPDSVKRSNSTSSNLSVGVGPPPPKYMALARPAKGIKNPHQELKLQLHHTTHLTDPQKDLIMENHHREQEALHRRQLAVLSHPLATINSNLKLATNLLAHGKRVHAKGIKNKENKLVGCGYCGVHQNLFGHPAKNELICANCADSNKYLPISKTRLLKGSGSKGLIDISQTSHPYFSSVFNSIKSHLADMEHVRKNLTGKGETSEKIVNPWDEFLSTVPANIKSDKILKRLSTYLVPEDYRSDFTDHDMNMLVLLFAKMLMLEHSCPPIFKENYVHFKHWYLLKKGFDDYQHDINSEEVVHFDRFNSFQNLKNYLKSNPKILIQFE